MPGDIAIDGVHEYLDVFVATDLGHTVRRDLARLGPVTTLRGTASDLLLSLWHRRYPLDLFAGGDRELVAAWPHI